MATQAAARADLRARGDSYRGERLASTSLAMLFMIVFAVYFLLPVVWLLFSATKTNGDLVNSFGLWFAPQIVIGQNLHDVFTRDEGHYLPWLFNTVIYAGVSATGGTLIASLAGYALAKFRFPGREVIFAIMLGSIMVPGAALVLPLFLLMSYFHLINTYWAVILPSMVNVFGVYLMRVYSSQSVPDEMLDASRIDGAGEFRTFWSVAMPVLVPGFVTVFLLAFVGAWNNFFLPLVVLSDPKLFPLTLGLATWQTVQGGASQITYSMIITGAVVAVIPLVAAFLLLQRYWRSGLTVGAIKA
jgi:multiple sugar transport system permease protein